MQNTLYTDTIILTINDVLDSYLVYIFDLLNMMINMNFGHVTFGFKTDNNKSNV